MNKGLRDPVTLRGRKDSGPEGGALGADEPRMAEASRYLPAVTCGEAGESVLGGIPSVGTVQPYDATPKPGWAYNQAVAFSSLQGNKN